MLLLQLQVLPLKLGMCLLPLTVLALCLRSSKQIAWGTAMKVLMVNSESATHDHSGMGQAQAPAGASPSPITAVCTDHDRSPQPRQAPFLQPEAASTQHIISSARSVCFPARKPFVALNKMAEGNQEGSRAGETMLAYFDRMLKQ